MAPHIPDGDFVEYMAARSLWLRRVAFLLCQDWDQADDLAQTAMTKLYAHWPRARRFDNLDGYLRTILVNTFLSETRRPWWKRMVSPEHVLLDQPVETPDLDASLDVRDALTALPPRQRATIVLRYYCDLSVEQTAAELGCSQGTVKSNTSRGLASLRVLLEAGGGASA
jgi:RNA polymerase sigma-70 factor (sigma-E family)